MIQTSLIIYAIGQYLLSRRMHGHFGDTHTPRTLPRLHRAIRNQVDLRKVLCPNESVTSLFCDIPGTEAVVPSSVKGLTRICEKVYNECKWKQVVDLPIFLRSMSLKSLLRLSDDGCFSYLLDISRASVVCDNLKSLTMVVEKVVSLASGPHPKIQVVRLKNRFRQKGSGGCKYIQQTQTRNQIEAHKLFLRIYTSKTWTS